MHAQKLPARHEHAQVRTFGEQRRELRRGVHHLLEVVEQQQHLLVTDVPSQPAFGSKDPPDRLADQGRIA